MGVTLAQVVNLPTLAAMYGKVGRVEEGLAVVAEVLAVVDRTGLRVIEPGTHMIIAIFK
jgi:hypothetical protein